VTDRERVLGPDHRLTLGRPAEAIAQYEKAIPGLDRQLGPHHPLTINARSSLDQARHPATTPAATPPPN